MSQSLYIFDFDDTLVDSGARVIVKRKSGKKDFYTSKEYRDYERLYKLPGDKLNFSEFDVYPPGASVIKSIWSKFTSALKTVGPERVMILTARENPVPVKKFLSDMGVNPLPIIEAVGDSNPAAKKRKVLEYVKRLNITEIYLWEDSPNNITSIETLESDSLSITSTLVSEGLLRKLIQKILRESLLS
ncbi:hypothetical protein OAA09_00730 [bacterium]|nr:hypothetical protein [bacterium]